MNKAEYREYFAECKKMLKLNYFLKLCNISNSNFSYFLKSSNYDFMISIEKLEQLEKCIDDELFKI